MMKSRIKQYGLMVAGATGMLGATVADTAEAEIISHTGLSIAIPTVSYGRYDLGARVDLDGGGDDVSIIRVGGLVKAAMGPLSIPESNWSPDGFFAGVYGTGSLNVLSEGTIVDYDLTFGNGSGRGKGSVNSDGFLGLRFRLANSGPYNFGWIEVKDIANTGRRIVGFGYETTPNAGIAAGAVPEPGSLALLALGAVGVMTRRNRK